MMVKGKIKKQETDKLVKIGNDVEQVIQILQGYKEEIEGYGKERVICYKDNENVKFFGIEKNILYWK